MASNLTINSKLNSCPPKVYGRTRVGSGGKYRIFILIYDNKLIAPNNIRWSGG